MSSNLNNSLNNSTDANTSDTILEVSGLNKAFERFALEDVTFSVPRGYIMGFIGPNGAGKTTTIKLILNVISSDSGKVKIFGKESSASINEKIGVVMDAPMYVDEWTVSDVEAALAPFYLQWDSDRYAAYLRQFGIDANKRIKELSRGMKVKLQIAVALSHHAQLLLLDEPTSGLDPVARDEICDLLREFVADENNSVLFSTHITSDLEKTADYITFILNGRIVFTGAKDDLLESYARVTGGLEDINEDHRKLIVGYREHRTGFEGMIEASKAGILPRTVLVEPISLDEIIIFMNKGAVVNG
ncbi:MAG: ABC transporter ATP-binding protein [Coriobacteriaceae bacterium]|nr:ABC transporter ATP-binding protein [Coriobacteriaceae bacterium]